MKNLNYYHCRAHCPLVYVPPQTDYLNNDKPLWILFDAENRTGFPLVYTEDLMAALEENDIVMPLMELYRLRAEHVENMEEATTEAYKLHKRHVVINSASLEYEGLLRIQGTLIGVSPDGQFAIKDAHASRYCNDRDEFIPIFSKHLFYTEEESVFAIWPMTKVEVRKWRKDFSPEEEISKETREEIRKISEFYTAYLESREKPRANSFYRDDPMKTQKSKGDKEEEIRLPKDYDPSLVNVSIDPEEIVKKLSIALGKEDRPNCISLLFHGIPGTGKTLAAKYVAKSLGKPLHVHKMSDFLDKYIGESEKNISKSFKDAEEKGAIILIDEIEGVTGNRKNLSKSWEITVVNTVLQCMDDYDGIIFATTNDLDAIDPAIARRFLLKQCFSNLTAEQAQRMAKMVFPKRRLGGFSEEVFAPSDFALVKDSLLFIEDEKINKVFIMERLREEAAIRNGGEKHPVGFHT